MSLDLAIVVREWPMVVGGVVAFMIAKGVGIYAVARLTGSPAHRLTGSPAPRRTPHAAGERAALFAQRGEFAFVLYAAALAVGLFDARIAAIMSAVVILSMALTPLVLIARRRLVRDEAVSLDGVDVAEHLSGQVLVIGFGRFAQVMTQALLARNVRPSLIEADVDMIRAAETFGVNVYYGDGTRLDVLHASGAARAEAILVCVDKPASADRIVDLCHSEFPLAALFVRAFDRGHTLRLIGRGVDFQLRETFESALVFGGAVLEHLGVEATEARGTIADIRKRDEDRVGTELIEGIEAGCTMIRGDFEVPHPSPFCHEPKNPSS